MNTKVTLNTTIKSLPKNEILDFAPRGNGGVFIHNGNTICHTEGEARSISKEVQNRDISAFSKPQYDNVSVSRDISVASLPQYDKHTVIASERNFSRHCETYEVSRGNLVRVAKDFRNAQLAIQGDCHESACTDSRNDEKSAFTRNSRGLPRLALSKSRNDEKAQDCHDFAFPKSRNDGQSAKSRNDKNTHHSKNLAISLATATAMAATSLTPLAAACVQRTYESGKYLDCNGSFSPQSLQSAIDNKNMLINLGWANTDTTVSGGQVSVTIGNNFIFRNVNATNVDFIINGTSLAGLHLPYTQSNHTENASSLRTLVVKGTLNNTSYGSYTVYNSLISLDVHAGTSIGYRDADGRLHGGIYIDSGAKVTNAMAIYGGYAGGNKSTYVSQITNAGTIDILNIGYHQFAGDYATLLGSYYIDNVSYDKTSKGSSTIGTLNIYQATLTLDTDGNDWSQRTKSTDITLKTGYGNSEHIASAGSITNVGTVGEGAIRINIGENVKSQTQVYKYASVILDEKGTKGNGKVNFYSLRGGLGTALHRAYAADGSEIGFTVSPDIATSYGSSMWRTLSLSYARRSIMLQNMLDSVIKKNFKSSGYDKSVQRARGEIFETNKFTGETRYNPSMRKLANTGKQRKRTTKIESKFLPYDSKKSHIAFFVPYAVNSLADLGITNALEWAGGLLAGVQRDLKAAGIVGAYAAYEYSHITTTMLGANSTTQTNALQAGLTYFKVIPIQSKKRQFKEGFFKANLRSGVDIPMLEAQSPVPHIKFELEGDKGITFPLMWSFGVEARGGWTFYQYKSGGYLTPEFGVSYDLLAPLDMKLQKNKYGLGGNEYYPKQYWHLPQIGASLKYYKVWNESFKTSFLGGLRYNILNTPTGHFRIGGLSGSGKIYLPALYANLDMDFIWIIKQNHELSFGYNGIFYSNFNFANDDDSSSAQRFNGMSNALNIKYSLWFGGDW